VALLFFGNGLVVGSWLPRLPEIRDRLGIDLAAIGFTLALGGLGSLAGSSTSGLVVTRLGARRTAALGGSMLFLALPLISVVPTAALLSALLAIMGLLDALADVGMNAVGIRVEESVGRSIMTRLHGLWSLGTLVGSGVAAVAILIGVELGAHLAVVSVVGLAAVIAANRLIPDTRPRAKVGARSGALAVGLMLAGATAVFIEGTPFDWSALFLRDVVGTGEALAGAGVILYTGGMLAGRLGGDHLIDRLGAVPTLFGGIVLSVTAALAVVAAAATATALVGFALWGLGISVALPVLYKLAGSHPSFSEGAGLAALTVGTRLGFMVSPALVGVAAEVWSLPVALGVVVSVAAVATTIATRLTLGRPSQPDDSQLRPSGS
jgi:MFS family permease